MGNQHKKISGYRDLTQAEIDLMNEAKEIEARVNSFIDKLRGKPDVRANVSSGEPAFRIDQRHVAVGATNIETGFMYLVKAVAKPERKTD